MTHLTHSLLADTACLVTESKLTSKIARLPLLLSVQNEYNLLAEISMILTSLDCLSDRLKEELAMGCIGIEKASFDESSYKISIS